MNREGKSGGPTARGASGMTRRCFVRAGACAAIGCLLGACFPGCAAQDASATPAMTVKVQRAMPGRGRHAAVLLEEWSTSICHLNNLYSGDWVLSITYALCNEGEGYLYSSGDVYIVAKQGKNTLTLCPQDPDGNQGAPPRQKVMPGEQKEMWQTWSLVGTEPVTITFNDVMTNELLARATVDVAAGDSGVL